MRKSQQQTIAEQAMVKISIDCSEMEKAFNTLKLKSAQEICKIFGVSGAVLGLGEVKVETIRIWKF